MLVELDGLAIVLTAIGDVAQVIAGLAAQLLVLGSLGQISEQSLGLLLPTKPRTPSGPSDPGAGSPPGWGLPVTVPWEAQGLFRVGSRASVFHK